MPERHKQLFNFGRVGKVREARLVATGEQLKALVKSHIERDEERFFTLALQVAAHEARRGHGKLAKEIRELIDRAKTTAARQSDSKKPVAIVHPRGELAGLFSASYPKLRLAGYAVVCHCLSSQENHL